MLARKIAIWLYTNCETFERFQLTGYIVKLAQNFVFEFLDLLVKKKRTGSEKKIEFQSL